MIPVIIAIVDSVPAWPDDLDKFVFPGVMIGADYVVDYIGELSLTGYQGTWPIPKYREAMSAPEFLSLFTATEFTAIYASTIEEICQLRKMLEVITDSFDIRTNVLINTGIDALETVGLITSDRADEIRLGYPG